MKFNKKWLQGRWVPYTIATCTAVILYLFLSHINFLWKGIEAFFGFISPVIYGLIIAYIMNPLVELFEDHTFKKMKKGRRMASVILATFVVLLLFAVLMIALIPQIIDSITQIVNNFDSYAKGLQNLIASVSGKHNLINFSDLSKHILTAVSQLLPKNTGSIIETSFSIGSGIFNGVISCFIALYFLIDAKRMQNNLRKIFHGLMSQKVYHQLTGFWRRCNHILVRYIVFDIIDGCIIGISNFIFFLITGMPYSVLISVVVGVTNLAPTFGPLVGGAIGAAILVLVNPWYALWFIIFTICLQTLDGYFIKPKLFGDTLGVPSIWILIFIIVGGRMFGVWGILLAIPFAAIINYLYEDVFMKWIARRNKQKETQYKSFS